MHVVSMGDNTYAITREAGTTFSRDTEALKAQAKEDAAKFCATQGKQLQVVDILVHKPLITMGYVQAKIIFKAVDARNPSLTSEPAPVAVGEKPTPVVVSEKPATGDLYTELIKLDDLRKRGILTEEEFQAEKKKVLSRSQ